MTLHWHEESRLRRKPVVAIDIDGVLADIQVKVDAAWRAAGLPYSKKDVLDFDYRKCVGVDAHKVAMAVFNRADLYDDMTVNGTAEKVLTKLRERARVIALSAPFPKHAYSKWHFALRAGFANEDIILTAAKELVKADVLVDDKAETVLSLPYPAVLFDQPWNRWAASVDPRARTWSDVHRYVEEVIG